MNVPFKYALIVSSMIHAALIGSMAGPVSPRELVRHDKPLEVDYVVIKEVERKLGTARVSETPKVELKKEVIPKEAPPQEAAKGEEGPRDARQDLAGKQARLKRTKDYIGYFQIIREKIRRRLKDNYRDYLAEGEVHLEFALRADGVLLTYDAAGEKAAEDKVLREIALRSLKEAAPFPAFPKRLNVPQMSFNLAVSFKRE